MPTEFVRPTVFIDDEVCVKDGRLAVLDHPDIQQKIHDFEMSV